MWWWLWGRRGVCGLNWTLPYIKYWLANLDWLLRKICSLWIKCKTWLKSVLILVLDDWLFLVLGHWHCHCRRHWLCLGLRSLFKKKIFRKSKSFYAEQGRGDLTSFLTIYGINWIFNQWNIGIWGHVVVCFIPHPLPLCLHNHHQTWFICFKWFFKCSQVKNT